MYVINIEVVIAGKTFSRVNAVEIVSSRQVIEDVATLRVPATARMERQGVFISEVETAKTFKAGDPVEIRLGYNGVLRTEFRGFVRSVKPGIPVEIKCEDYVYQLRRKNIKKSLKHTDLKTLLSEIVAGTDVRLSGEVPDIKFTHFYFKNVSGASALQKLKDEYGLTVYLTNANELQVGISSFTDGTLVKYRFGENVISSDLEWVTEEDKRLKIKAVHWRRNNTKLEKEIGDADGEQRTLFFYNIDNERDLERLALEEIKKYKYTGYKGGLQTFLLPVAQVGNVAIVEDPQFAERAGNYLIDKVTTTVGEQGARRKIELGLKVSKNG